MRLVSHVVAIVVAIVMSPVLKADHHLESVNLSGVWNATASSDGNERKITWTFTKSGNELTGVSLDLENGEERKLDRITVDNKKVTLEIDIEQDGNQGVIRVEAEQKAAGKLEGKWSIVDDAGTEYMSGDVSAVKEVAFAGEWDATATLPDGRTLDSVLQLKGGNTKLKGVINGDAGETQIETISVSDRQLRLEFAVDMNGESIDVVIEAKPEGDDKLAGNWMVIGDDGSQAAEGAWSAARKAQGFAGAWAVVAAVPDNQDYTGTLTLTVQDGSYSGVSTGSNGETKGLDKVDVDGDELEYSLPFDQGGYTGTITVQAKRNAEGSLEGEWVLTGEDGNEYARESWKATRQ